MSTPTKATKLTLRRSQLVQDIKSKNPRLGIARIVRLIELQEQYAAMLQGKSNSADERTKSYLAEPLWNTTLQSSFAWIYSYAPYNFWESLDNGNHTIHSIRSALTKELEQGVI